MTCSVQATFLTGRLPREHGIVGNGWYFRDLAEVWFWRQSNHLVAGEKVWERGATPRSRPSPARSCSGGTTCTRRRTGRRDAAPDVPRRRPQAPRRLHAARRPARRADRTSSARSRCSTSGGRPPTSRPAAWIAERAAHVLRRRASPTLDARLPAAPRLRPAAARARRAIRRSRQRAARRRRAVRRADRPGAQARRRRVVVLSEYGITAVQRRRRTSTAPCARRAGCACARSSAGELLDAGRLARPSRSPTTRWRTSTCATRARRPRSQALLAAHDGVERVLGRGRASAPPASTTRARASSWRSARPTAGSPTTTGSTTTARPTSRAPSTSTASPATTRSSCSSIPALLGAQAPQIAWTLAAAERSASARCWTSSRSTPRSCKGSHGRLTDRPEDGPLFITQRAGRAAAGRRSQATGGQGPDPRPRVPRERGRSGAARRGAAGARVSGNGGGDRGQGEPTAAPSASEEHGVEQRRCRRCRKVAARPSAEQPRGGRPRLVPRDQAAAGTT